MASVAVRGAHYLAEKLTSLGWSLPFSNAFFKECVITPDASTAEVVAKSLEAGFLVGPMLDRFADSFCEETRSLLKNAMLIAVTEKHSQATLDQFAELFNK
ncbi:MAG: hypothetical protein R3C11_26105 [Planctomycetaceae bacterium]